MDGLAISINALQGDLDRFLRTPRLRLWWIRCDAKTQTAATDFAMAGEHHPANLSLFVDLHEAHLAGAAGWDRRAEELRQHYARRQQQGEKAGTPLPDLPPSQTTDPRVAFAQQVWQLTQIPIAGVQGLTILLAPQSLDDGEAWTTSLKILLSDPRLRDVRWVVVEATTAFTAPIVQAQATETLTSTFDLPADAGERAIADLVASPAKSGPAAGIRLPLPEHPAVTTPPPPDEVQTARLALRTNLLEAVLAHQRGDLVRAVEQQRQARDVCDRAGFQSEAITMQTLLGAYLLAARRPKEADTALQEAVQRAKDSQQPAALATAELSLGASKMTQRDPQGALVHYAESTVAAEHSSPIVAIEAARTTGQIASDLGMEAQAIAFWSKAVKLAEQRPALARLSSASLAATGLVNLCRKRGLHAKADELAIKAKAFGTMLAPEASDDFGLGMPDAMLAASASLPSAQEVADSPAPRELVSAPAAAPQIPPASPARIPAVAKLPPSPPPLYPRPSHAPAAPPPSARDAAVHPPSRHAVDPAHARVDAPGTGPALLNLPPGGLPASDDDNEGTDLLSVEEIGAAHGWSDADIAALRRTTIAVLDVDSTAMLTKEELAQLTGLLPLSGPTLLPPTFTPVEPAVEPSPTEPTADPLAEALAKMSTLRDVVIADETDGGSRMVRKPKPV